VLGQERLGDGVIGRIWRDLFSLQRPRPFSIGDMHLLLFESPAHFLGQFVEKLADGAVIKVAGILREDLSPAKIATGSRWLAASPPESA